MTKLNDSAHLVSSIEIADRVDGEVLSVEQELGSTVHLHLGGDVYVAVHNLAAFWCQKALIKHELRTDQSRP